MTTKIVYGKYDSLIDVAIFKFKEDDDTQKIVLKVEEVEVINDGVDIGETPIPPIEVLTEKRVIIKSVDTDGIEIENSLSKEDLRTFMSVVRNLIKQI